MFLSPIIYVIDDSEIDCLVVSKLLERKFPFLKVIVFNSADEALEAMKKPETHIAQFPSLILLDVNMPIKTGWDFLKEFSLLPTGRYSDTKIIIFTSSIHPDDRLQAGKYEMVVDFIIKPLKKEDIDEKIGAHFLKSEF